MDILDKLIEIFGSSEFNDVLVQGYIESDSDISKFCPVLHRIHICLGGIYVNLDNDLYNKYMYLRSANSIEVSFEIDEDDEFSVSSYLDFSLMDTVSKLSIAKVEIFDIDVANEGLKCNALALYYSNGEILFVDPSFHDGMKLGGRLARERFIDEFPDSKAAVYQISI